MHINEIWQEVLFSIKDEISPLAFTTWISPLNPVSYHDGNFVLEVQDEFCMDQVVKYRELIKNALLLKTSVVYEVNFVLKNSPQHLQSTLDLKSGNFMQNEIRNSQELQDFSHLQGTDNNYSNSKDSQRFYKKSPFNEHYKFDNFIVGDSNRFAHAACYSVALNPGENSNNPLFIYGGSGLGKTHLMNAIGNYIFENRPDLKTIYVACESFVNEFISAIQHNGYDRFRNKYRNCDFLFIDDIQFIEDKEQTQIEFFNTFNSLYENNCNIVITCDKPPQSLVKLEERLRTRFSSGLIVDIQKPNFETRLAILEKLAQDHKIEVNIDVMNYIANNITSNIRELEGAFNTVLAYSNLVGNQINMATATAALKSSINPSLKDKPSSDFIIDIICNYFNMNKNELTSKNKKKNLAEARQIAMYILFKYGNMTYNQIGMCLGGKHHSTVMHGIEKIETEIVKENNYIISAVNNISHNIIGHLKM